MKDKLLLTQFAALVEIGKLDRACDLVIRFHLKKSYDLAIIMANHNHTLIEFIEDTRDTKFGESEEELFAESSFNPTALSRSSSQGIHKVTPDARPSKRVNPVKSNAVTRQVRSKQGYV